MRGARLKVYMLVLVSITFLKGQEIHIVKTGETVYKILKNKYGKITPKILNQFKGINPHIKNINLIRPGDTLYLPIKEKTEGFAIIDFKGDVWIIKNGQKNRPKTAQFLKKGDTIVVIGIDSYCEVQSQNGSYLRLTEGKFIVHSGEIIEFTRGRGWGNFHKLKKGNLFQFQTPRFTAAIRGTKTSIKVNKTAYCKVFEGTVEIDGRKIEKGKGFFIDERGKISIKKVKPDKWEKWCFKRDSITIEAPEVEITIKDSFFTNKPKIKIEGKTEPFCYVYIDTFKIPTDTTGKFEAMIQLKIPIKEVSIFPIKSERKTKGFGLKFINVIYDTMPPKVEIKGDLSAEIVITTKNKIKLEGSTEKTAKVFVNGKMIKNIEGKFEEVITLKKGINFVKIEIVDRAGNKTIITREIRVIR